jgi:hypothetical protein
MDGVLCDFEKRFVDLYGEDALKLRDRKNFTKFWPEFIKDKQFEQLDWFPGGQELLTYLKRFDVNIEILSSSGGLKHHSLVEEQKKVWLKKNGIAYKPNIVSGRKKKKEYAKKNIILIDDTEDVITEFNRAGGIGILHKDVKDTLKTLDALLNK